MRRLVLTALLLLTGCEECWATPIHEQWCEEGNADSCKYLATCPTGCDANFDGVPDPTEACE